MRKLSARPRSPAPLQRTPFSLGTWPRTQPRPALGELCLSNLEPDPEGLSKFEAATRRGNPLAAAERGLPTAVSAVRASVYFSP